MTRYPHFPPKRQSTSQVDGCSLIHMTFPQCQAGRGVASHSVSLLFTQPSLHTMKKREKKLSLFSPLCPNSSNFPSVRQQSQATVYDLLDINHGFHTEMSVWVWGFDRICVLSLNVSFSAAVKQLCFLQLLSSSETLSEYLTWPFNVFYRGS